MCHFCLATFNVFSLYLVFIRLAMICLGFLCFKLIFWGSWASWNCISFITFGKLQTIFFSNIFFFLPTLSRFFPKTHITHILAFQNCSTVLKVCLFFHCFFTPSFQIAWFLLTYLQVHWMSFYVFSSKCGSYLLCFSSTY